MTQNDLTPTEQDIIAILRDLRPFERIEVVKDRGGVIESYMVVRSQKIVIGRR